MYAIDKIAKYINEFMANILLLKTNRPSNSVNFTKKKVS